MRFLVLEPDDVPPRWRGRAVAAVVVPLLSGEAAELLGEGTALPGLAPADEQLAHLAARGLAAPQIASELQVTTRSVYRRLARLREHVGVRSAAELAVVLARAGFGGRHKDDEQRRRNPDGLPEP